MLVCCCCCEPGIIEDGPNVGCVRLELLAWGDGVSLTFRVRDLEGKRTDEQIFLGAWQESLQKLVSADTELSARWHAVVRKHRIG